MREIKFRAWDKERKIMFSSKCLDLLIHFNGKLQSVDKRGSIKGTVNTPQFELMQYTGLKDKNGKDIYEGDIVKMHYFFENFDNYTLGAYEDEEEIIGIVKIDELSTYTDCPDNRYDWINYLQEPSEELEVIGNIYENPELLEV